MNHVANIRLILILLYSSVAFKGYTVAMNLSTAISTRLRMDTTVDTLLTYTPILHPGVARGP